MHINQSSQKCAQCQRRYQNEYAQEIEWELGGLELWHTHQIIVEACLVDIAENAWESEKENAENNVFSISDFQQIGL